MRIALAAVSILLLACGGHRLVPAQVRCERGGYLESADLCETLSHDAKDRAEKLRFELLAARNKMWACNKLDAPTCGAALDTLWLSSPDPQEVATVLVLSQKACAAGVNAGCIRARNSAWVGRGTPVDVRASIGWHRKCASCGPWVPYDLDQQPSWPPLDAGKRIERARALVSLGALTAATTVISGELAAGMLAGRESDARALLQSSLATRWAAEVEPHIATEPLQALAAAEQLVSLDRADAALAGRRDRIRTDLAAAAVERMTGAAAALRPMGVWFHAARAAQLGAKVSVPKVDVVALWDHLKTRPQVTPPPTCEWMRGPMASSYPADRANMVVTANLTCEVSEKAWSTNETYTWNETVEVERTRTVAGTTSSSTGSYVSCTGFGMKAGDACGYTPTTTTTTPDHEVTYTEKTTVPHEDTREVKHRRLSAAVTGSLTSEAGTVPVDFRRVVEETAYSSPHGSKSFGTDDLASLQRAGTAALTSELERMSAAVRSAEATSEMRAAEVERDPIRAEERLLRAVTLGDPGQQLRTRYGLTITVQQLLDGAPLALPSVAPAIQVIASVPVPQAISGGHALSHYPAEPTIDGTRIADDRRGGIFRLIERTKLVWDRSDRTAKATAGDLTTTMLGARIERGWNLPPNDSGDLRLGWKPGFVLGGGGDGDLGAYFEARAGVAAGVTGNGWQFLFIGGGGYSGIGVRDMLGHSAMTSNTDVFWGSALRFGLDEGLSIDGSLRSFKGGPLGSETRYTAQALYRLESGTEYGIELSFRAFPDQGETITGLGVVLRAPNVFKE